MNRKARAASSAMTVRNSPVRLRLARLSTAPIPAMTNSHVSLGLDIGNRPAK